jgi:peptidoglycan DL-endopeptidase CwlO
MARGCLTCQKPVQSGFASVQRPKKGARRRLQSIRRKKEGKKQKYNPAYGRRREKESDTQPAVILPRLNEQQREIYTVMQQLKGNKPYLWEGIYNGGEDTGPSYEIPGEALDDPAFAALMEEATKYIGWPYVWGGSSPSTSFDCSGFVCWVYTASGVHNLPRTTAQGIYNQCAIISPSEAKPGDIIFFTGTYDSPGPVSHVGIYVGDGMMLHCGSPIQYANINSSYWQTHFYAFGRL